MQNPSDVSEGLSSMQKILDYYEDDEQLHFKNNEEPGEHIYREFAAARDSINVLTELMDKKVSAYGQKVTVSALIFALDEEERDEYFSDLAENLAMEDHAPFVKEDSTGEVDDEGD